jgi:PKD repeat protein
MTHTHNSLMRTLSVLLAVAVAVSATAGFASAAATTDLTVSITDDDNTLEPGETTTVEIAVANADGGVGAGELGIELGDPGVATITDVSVLHDPGSTDNAVVGGGQSADLKWAFADSPDTGSVTIVEATLQAASPGSTDVNVVQNSDTGNVVVGDEGGNGYTLATVGSATLTVEAPAEDPVASFTFDPSSPDAGQSVSFDASGSTDDGSIASYEWDFGDGETASGASTSHTFDSAGDYDVQLTVTDDEGATATATQTVQVQSADTDPGQAPSTAMHLDPTDELVGVDQTATFDIVVDSADGGVGTYDISVALSDSSAASITDVELAGTAGPEVTDVEIASDGSEATMEAVLVDTADTGSVSIGTVTLQGTAEGSTDLDLAVDELGTEAGTAYVVTATDGASVDVSTLVVGDSQSPAQDLDGDGVYEDVNGDGTVSVLDVQTLFADRDGTTVTNNPAAFDFNDDGEFSLLDIQTLYYEEIAS